MKEILISEKEEGQTIYKFVRKYLSEAPLSFIEKVFRKKDIKINGIRVNKQEIVHKGDLIQIYITDAMLNEFLKPKPITEIKNKPNVIYEDNNILIVNKPSGLLVHGDNKEKRMTLSNIVLNYLYSKGEYDPSNNAFIPAPAHRIDRNTSGLVIFGKNIKALQELEDLFKEHENIEKYYLALVNGKLTKGGKVDAPLLKDEVLGKVEVKPLSKGGKEALTLYEVEEVYKKYTLLKVQILTGRTHQIRVHMAYIGYPLLGDSKYGDFKENKYFKEKFSYEGQFLHSYIFRFNNINGSLSYLSNKEFKAPLGEKERKIISKLKNE